MESELNQLRRKLDEVKGRLEVALKDNSELKQEIEQLKKDKAFFVNIISADTKAKTKAKFPNPHIVQIGR